MIRVAFINHHGALPGGGERGLEAYLRRIPADVDACVFLFEEGAYAKHLRALDIRVYVVPVSEQLMSVTREAIRGAYAVDGVRHVLLLRKLLSSLNVDVVVTSSMKAHVIGALAARLCGIPVVTWLKDLPEGLALKLIRTVSRTCAIERIVCSKAVVRALGLGHTTMLLPPIDFAYHSQVPSQSESRALLGLPKDKLVFSMVGRIARWKGQDRFVRAAARVCALTDAVYFSIFGSPAFPQDHEFANELPALATHLGIAERVSFVSWMDDPRIAYAASDLICNASTAEPFGRTSAEAGLYGVPALCFDDGGASEAVLPAVTGTVVPAGDVEAFAAAMVAYASDPAALRRAGSAARVYVQRHDADRLAAIFFEIVRRASLKGRAARSTVPTPRIPETGIPVVPAIHR